jgi:hypothetical protein
MVLARIWLDGAGQVVGLVAMNEPRPIDDRPVGQREGDIGAAELGQEHRQVAANAVGADRVGIPHEGDQTGGDRGNGGTAGHIIVSQARDVVGGGEDGNHGVDAAAEAT